MLTKALALRYAAATALPLLVGGLWFRLPDILQQSPAYVCALLVGVVARFIGFGPALATTGLSVAVLLERGFPTHSPSLDASELITKLSLFLGASVIIASISRQKSREVLEAEGHYRALVELSPDGISVSRNGVIIFTNSGLARMLGARSAKDLIGKHYSQVVHVESVAKVEERIRRVEAGEAVPWIEEKWIRLDGTTIEVENSAVPMRRQGQLLVQLFTRDLTERKEAARKLDESYRRLQALFETSIDAILFIDGAGHYIDANPAASALLGYSREELARMKVGDLTPPERAAEIREIWRRISAGEDVAGDFVARKKDGNARTIEFRMKANVLPGLHYSVIHDVSRQKEAEANLRNLSLRLLRSQDEERRRIARQLHETTAQTLAALRMNLARLNESARDDQRELTRDSIELTEQAIREIRTLSYLLHPPLMEELGLVPALKWYVSGFEQRSGIAVTLDIPNELERLAPEIENAVFRIVQEALSNIHRHSGSAVASIRVARQETCLLVEIADRGRGLPAGISDRLSEPAALGVGIAGMNERIRELHGEMQIRSGDDGTTLSVRLPLQPKTECSATA